MSTATSDTASPDSSGAPLRVAVPNKGALSDAAATMLREAGYRIRRDRKELVVVDRAANVELFYLRPRDIAVYVGAGTVDCGITGRDLLIDSGSDAVEVMGLGFGASTFRWAAKPGTASALADIDGKRIATSYAHLVRDHLLQSGIDADVVRLDGAVETAITLGVADVIADVVETGATLRSQGLEPFGDPILRSEAVLIAASDERSAAIDVLERRLRGVVTARNYVLMDYDVPNEVADAAMAITPGLESPTVSPLQDREWSAIRAMVPRADTNTLMDELYALGARAILITDISACRI